jgi:hypothetical protein
MGYEVKHCKACTFVITGWIYFPSSCNWLLYCVYHVILYEAQIKLRLEETRLIYYYVTAI